MRVKGVSIKGSSRALGVQGLLLNGVLERGPIRVSIRA